MKTIARAALVAVAIFIMAGCVTPINWQARVGVYTYDQAVMDYGPPMAQVTLSDHSTVVEWMVERGAVVSTPAPYFYGPGYWGPAYYYPTYFPARFLRLQFAPGGKLKAWKEYSK